VKLRALGARLPPCVAPNAFVARDAVLGDNTIVNTLASVDHDCVLGSHSQLTAGVHSGGWIRAGENCFFGIKSAVLPRVTIGDDVVVMAGALVTRSVPDGVMVNGRPARVLRHL